MNITLKIAGEDKTFSVFFIAAKYMRKALQLRQNMNLGNLSAEDLDEISNFIIEVFDNQFTYDELWAGISYDKLIEVLVEDIFFYIMTGQKKPESGTDEKK